ncbi:BTAD domain-containing putative transcriptional regulator [Bradyrhizobium brasilense]|uniref:BTAD domain-containing putative transcriptional regulator n=1 Tax=Bradyrhizobium brasilense TaxID=1419277 RepID=A0ABY8JKU1_9BRAD|nr:BTAD domain-containing putative transcriptional regulator [Bradyrhizobium brasilense]WFU66190.1 BTAD domain-containing putative transcriptional regulator [Bradyrhizobium brasilense]
MVVRLNLLGDFRIVGSDGEPVSLSSVKGRVLLASLALGEQGASSRDELTELLWEDRRIEQAQLSLRQELARLRSVLKIPDVSEWSEKQLVRLPRCVSTDIADFLTSVRAGDCTAAALSYGGELLANVAVKAPKLSAWLAQKRNELRNYALSSCLSVLLNANEDAPGELLEKTAGLAVQLDPFCELAHQWLIRIYARRGNAILGLEQFRVLSAALHRDGGRQPSEETMSILRCMLGRSRSATSARQEGKTATGVDWINEINRQHGMAAAPDPVPVIPASSEPSLVVLPFVDLATGGRPNWAISDGLTEEVTTALSRMPGLFVTARQSSMVYKGALSDVRTIAIELGVRYLVEGSIELSGRDVRVNARLIAGATGLSIWADAFEGKLSDFRLIRNSIVSEIVGRIMPTLMRSEVERAYGTPLAQLDAWTRLQRANGHVLFMRSREWLDKAASELKAALKLDPQYAMARSLLAAIYTWKSVWSQSRQAKTERSAALRHLEQALQDGPGNSFVQINCADVTLYSAGDIDRSLTLLEAATDEIGADPHGLALLANVKRCAGGDPDQSIELISRAMRRSPRDPRTHRWSHYAAWSHWKTGDLKQMEHAAKNAISLYSDAPQQWIALVCALGLQSREIEAREAARILHELLPTFTAVGFFHTARMFYGRKFEGQVVDDYTSLCEALERSLPP